MKCTCKPIQYKGLGYSYFFKLALTDFWHIHTLSLCTVDMMIMLPNSCIFTHPAHRAFIWSRVFVHQVDVRAIFTLFVALS